VLSVAKEAGSANIDAAAIPGFMAAMAMPYPIPDEKALANLAPGDEITADVVVGDGKYHLENIVVTKKADAAPKNPSSPSSGPSSQNLHEPAPGEKVPDFVLTNQDGKKFHLYSPQSGVTLVTFIYTRCPFADYCPLVSRNFAQIYAATRSNPKVRLVSVSFDPKHDTPSVLRQYGNTFTSTTGRSPFDRWQFATVQPQELAKITNFFGVFYDPSQDKIVHSLSTSVITSDGTIFKWYEGNDWKPADLVNDATTVLAQESKAGPSSAHLPLHETKPSAGAQPGF
jgi:protein SCO1/2